MLNTLRFTLAAIALAAAAAGFYAFSAGALAAPEPGVWALIAAGVVLIGFIARRRAAA